MGSKKKNSKNKEPIPKNSDTVRGAAQNSIGGHEEKKFTTDSRFASVHLDPRFAKLPNHKTKITIDPRFNRMFNGKNFASSTAQIDKRGKPKKDSSRGALKHYYRLEEEEGEERREKLKGKEEVEDEEEGESDEESDEREEDSEKPHVDLSDLEMGTDSDASTSDEEEESNDKSSTDTEKEDENGLSSEEMDTFVPDENVPEIDKETRRLAVVNLDWGRVKAVDLYVLLSSFLPKGGEVVSVSVYPSEFGLQRMKEEELHGPVGLFDDEKDKIVSDDDDDKDDDNDEIDNEKLRAYERSRLRYYYAAVECDSIATADYLYKTCDGVEFERSSNKLDLRFIPDSMEFKHPPRDVADKAPADYEGLDFQTRALQLSKIDLTWDEDEPQRTKSLKRKFNDEQLTELEIKEYLASDESETDEDENNEAADRSEKKHKKKDMYRALLQSGEGSDEGQDDDAGQDMEVTFNTGLEDLSKRILEKKDASSETVWEQHLKKMKEKKKARKNKSNNSSEDESDDDDVEPADEMDDFFIDESSVKGCKSKNSKKGKNNKDVDKEAEEKSRAELELLLADESGADAGMKGYNMKHMKVKGKKGKEIPNEGKIPTIDYEDSRFSSLFKSPLFALDPTDPQFKRSAAYARQMNQRQRMGEAELPSTKEHGELAKPAELESDDVALGKKQKKDKQEISSLVKSIKMKSKQVQ